MASGIYNHFKGNVMGAVYNLANGGDTVKVALLNNTHAFTATNDAWADVSANQITGTGYTAGGATLANQAVSVDDVDNEGVFDADDVAWTAASFTAYHAVIYDDTPTTPVADPLIASIDFGGAQTVTAGTFTIQWDAEGIINIT
jgi:hypothetical protein